MSDTESAIEKSVTAKATKYSLLLYGAVLASASIAVAFPPVTMGAAYLVGISMGYSGLFNLISKQTGATIAEREAKVSRHQKMAAMGLAALFAGAVGWASTATDRHAQQQQENSRLKNLPVQNAEEPVLPGEICAAIPGHTIIFKHQGHEVLLCPAAL